MSNGNPHKVMRPVVLGAAASYYYMANRQGDSQTSPVWTFDRHDGVPIPPDYVVEARFVLRYNGPDKVEGAMRLYAEAAERDKDTPR